MNSTWTIALTGPVTSPSAIPRIGDPSTFAVPDDVPLIQLTLRGPSVPLNLQVLVSQADGSGMAPAVDLSPFVLQGGGTYYFPRPARRAPATIATLPPPVPTRDGSAPLVPCYSATFQGFSVAVPWPPLVVSVQLLPGGGAAGTFTFTLGPSDGGAVQIGSTGRA